MNSRAMHDHKAKILYVLVFMSAFVLLFSLRTITAHAASSSASGIYFEIDKNPIESVKISADSDGNLMCGEIVQLSSTVYPENARETVLDITYEIVDGNNFAKIDSDKLLVKTIVPVGSRIEVISIVDGVKSENSLVFTVVRTPVQEIIITNTEGSLAIGGALKLDTVAFPQNATEKHVAYSIVSDTNYMQISYNGILSFNGKTIPEGELSVTVRATSTSDPDVFAEKTFTIYRPVAEPVDVTSGMTEIHQQCAYSFDTDVPFLNEIFGNNAVKYSVNADRNVAIIDVNGLLYVTANAPINTEIVVSMISYDEKICYEHNLIVTPAYATDFTPVMNTEPHTNISGNDYYLPGSSIVFDVVSYAPGNVTDTNKVFALRVSDDSIAYVDGHTVIIRDATEITTSDPHFEVTVYSEPNRLEQTFEIHVYIPLDSVVASPKPIRLEENNAYALTDLLECSLTPNNATAESIRYELVDVDESIATIRDEKLIINDDLPAGVVTVSLCVEINGVKSNAVEFDVYKPAHSITLDAEVNGEALSDTNLPISSKNTADTVTLITKVDELASINASDIIVTKGSEYINGEIKFVRTTDDGFAYFEFVLKKNLGNNAQCDRVIKLFATQDGVVSGETTIEIYVPNEDLSFEPAEIQRGKYLELVPNHTDNATNKMWEFALSDSMLALGVEKVNNNTISIPKYLGAGTIITLQYRSLDEKWYGASNEWQTVQFTVSAANDSSRLVYEGKSLQNGFNFVYGSDNASYTIVESNPQLWIGKYTDIEIKYINDFISEYGMTIKSVNVEGPGYEDISNRGESSIRIYMNSDAKGNESIGITVVISDGAFEYELNAGTLNTFRPMSGQLTFNTVTINEQNMISLVDRDSSTFDFDATYGLSVLDFKILSPIGIEITASGGVKILSYAISKNQSLEYRCNQYYNNQFVGEYLGSSALTIKTVAINKNSGTGGYDEIVAVGGMVGIGDTTMLNSIFAQRTGYKPAGYGTYIDASGKVIADYDQCGTLVTKWDQIKYYIHILKSCEQNCLAYALELPDGPYKYEDTLTFSAGSWKNHEFKYWEINGQKYYDKDVNLSCFVYEDGATVYAYCCWKENSCVATGTLITLADGTQKQVEDLDGSEQLLVWNFYTGTFDSAPILFIDTHGEKEYTVTHLYFEDGTIVDIIDEHGFWDVDLNQYVYLTDENAFDYIGHRFNKQYTDENGNLCYTSVKLTDAVNEQIFTNSYSPVTYSYLCYYVDGMLSVPSDTQGLTNYFDVDAETMQYDSTAMQSDIEQYGLFNYEDFADEVPKEIFDAVNGQYLKISMAKGLITEDYMAWLIETYSKYFYEGG